MSRDPAVDYTPSGLNKYIYCDNNPVNYIDPTGEYFIIDDIIAASIGAVNGVFRALGQGGNVWDAILGGVTGALSGWASYYTYTAMGGLTVDFFATTQSVTVGAGWNGVANASLTYSGANGGTLSANANVGFQVSSLLKVGGEVGVTFNDFNSKGFNTNDINTNIGLTASASYFGFTATGSVGVSFNSQTGYTGRYQNARLYGYGLEAGAGANWNVEGELSSYNARLGFALPYSKYSFNAAYTLNYNRSTGYKHGWEAKIDINYGLSKDQREILGQELEGYLNTGQAMDWNSRTRYYDWGVDVEEAVGGAILNSGYFAQGYEGANLRSIINEGKINPVKTLTGPTMIILGASAGYYELLEKQQLLISVMKDDEKKQYFNLQQNNGDWLSYLNYMANKYKHINYEKIDNINEKFGNVYSVNESGANTYEDAKVLMTKVYKDAYTQKKSVMIFQHGINMSKQDVLNLAQQMASRYNCIVVILPVEQFNGIYDGGLSAIGYWKSIDHVGRMDKLYEPILRTNNILAVASDLRQINDSEFESLKVVNLATSGGTLLLGDAMELMKKSNEKSYSKFNMGLITVGRATENIGKKWVYEEHYAYVSDDGNKPDIITSILGNINDKKIIRLYYPYDKDGDPHLIVNGYIDYINPNNALWLKRK